MKKAFQDLTAGKILNLAAAAFAAVALIGYSIAGQDSYGFVPMVDVFLVLGIVSALVFSVKDVLGLGSIVTIVCFSISFSVFIYSRFMYYAHQYYGIASDPISAAMIAATAGFAGMLLCELVSGFLSWGKER